MAALSSENKLRDVFNPKTVEKLANNIKSSWKDFDQERFISSIVPMLDELNFGERSNLIRDKLSEFLPNDFKKAVNILIDALDPELSDPGVTSWGSFTILPQCSWVSKHGREHFDLSMRALYEMTKRFSAEGDLRTFIEVDFERAMKLLHQWCEDESPHVRRLVSEGTRPRLPLAGRIRRFQKDPRPVLELLEKLKTDPELYVRRSVANNLNDIAKDNPNLVIKTLRNWSKVKNPGTRWIINHASRTLLKQGNKEALNLLGYTPKAQIKVSNLILQKKSIRLGERLSFSFKISSTTHKAASLMVDYVIHYKKSNGKLAPRVFKMRKIKLPGMGQLELSTSRKIENTSTRKIYTGKQKIELQINGVKYGMCEFAVRN